MFWKPGGEAPSNKQRDFSSAVDRTNFVFNKDKNLSLTAQRQKLPIFTYRNHILYLIENNVVTIVIGETGSGKSTQIPQYLAESNWACEGRRIAVTQPRRNSAVTLSTRVADEMHTHLGVDVGYQIRFERNVSDHTKIVYMTDGSLLREIMQDPLLNRYSVIVIDEVHERNINTDLLIALLRKILKQRPDLRLVLTSATTDAESIKRFFCTKVSGDSDSVLSCAILSVEGRNYPVNVNYAVSAVPDYLKAAVDLAMSIHEHKPMGDVLVFLTSQEEVIEAIKASKERIRKLVKPKQNIRVYPLYGSLPNDEQIKVFDTREVGSNTRRVIFSTNLAESSVTIPRIIYVIDTGLGRFKTFNAQSGLEIVIKSKISKASAVQRAGRAGRVGQGEVFRLYTENSFNSFPLETPPEMTRSNLFSTVLQLKAIGISNIVKFHFLTAPPSSHLCKTLETLHALGAIDDECNLTPRGFIMVEFPIDPMLTVSLLESERFGCTEEILTIIAMLQVKTVFMRPLNNKVRASACKFKFAAKEGDALSLLNVFHFFLRNRRSKTVCRDNFLNFHVLNQAESIRTKLVHLYRRYHKDQDGEELTSTGNEEAVRECLAQGMYLNSAYYHHTGVYKTFRDHFDLAIHPGSVLVSERPKYVIFNEVLSSSQNFMKDVTVIKSNWLTEAAPHYFANKFMEP